MKQIKSLLLCMIFASNACLPMMMTAGQKHSKKTKEIPATQQKSQPKKKSHKTKTSQGDISVQEIAAMFTGSQKSYAFILTGLGFALNFLKPFNGFLTENIIGFSGSAGYCYYKHKNSQTVNWGRANVPLFSQLWNHTNDKIFQKKLKNSLIVYGIGAFIGAVADKMSGSRAHHSYENMNRNIRSYFANKFN